MTTMNISLTPELCNIVQAKVASGMYSNASEVIRDAIRQLDQHGAMMYQYKLNLLKKALEPAMKEAEAGIFADYNLKAFIEELDVE